MSYAEAASRGPKQSPEEGSALQSINTPLLPRRAPSLPSLNQSSSGSNSLIDVDSDKVQSVASDFEEQAVKTRTQAERMEHEAEDSMRAKADSAAKKTGFKEKSNKEKAQDKFSSLRENSDNPVVIANAVLIAVGSAALGYGAYQKHTEGKLDWSLAGIAGGIVGAFAVGDYFVSSWLFKNKYPTK